MDEFTEPGDLDLDVVAAAQRMPAADREALALHDYLSHNGTAVSQLVKRMGMTPPRRGISAAGSPWPRRGQRKYRPTSRSWRRGRSTAIAGSGRRMLPWQASRRQRCRMCCASGMGTLLNTGSGSSRGVPSRGPGSCRRGSAMGARAHRRWRVAGGGSWLLRRQPGHPCLAGWAGCGGFTNVPIRSSASGISSAL